MNFLLKSLIPLTILVLFFALTQCKEDKECPVVITVKYYHDTTIVVADADVLIQKYNVSANGKTDANGRFEHTFKLEAILDVTAEKDTTPAGVTPPLPSLQGAAVVRLKPGETVHKTVFIQ
ncbi:MAG: hypothetical protein PHT69_07110 [Bacteroidales bacterium]|nr:hypothetical protein [Bacteroidales bacterium]